MAYIAQPNHPPLLVDHEHNTWQSFAHYLSSCRSVLCLTGAGLSAPSGLGVWRGTSGFWNNINVKDLASPYKFTEDPVSVWRFHGERMIEALGANPNAAHHALARYAATHDNFMVVSQNVDGLCEHAGHPPSRLLNIHGKLLHIRCVSCSYMVELKSLGDLKFLDLLKNSSNHTQIDLLSLPHCPECFELVRPDIVWFGERPPTEHLDTIDQLIDSGTVDLVLAVGTSLRVFPAAEFVSASRELGARLAVVNTSIEDGPADGLAHGDWFFEGDASTILPMILT